MKKVLSLVLCLFITLSLIIPFKVFADATYHSISTSCELLWEGPNQSNWYHYVSSNNDVRAVVLKKNGNTNRIYVSLSSTTINTGYSSLNNGNVPTCNGTTNIENSASFNGVTFYYLNLSNYTYDSTVIPVIDVPGDVTGNINQIAYQYTFGDLSEEPEESVIYGDLKELGFYTNFTNSQQSSYSAMKNNKDTIKWNGFEDSLGNPINTLGFFVDIQAAIVDYEANTKSDLLNQTISDMLTGDWTDIVTISPNVGKYEITWERVAQLLLSTNYNLDFWNKLSIFQGYNQSSQLKYMKEGWIYRIRLRNDVDEYVGDWQIIYTLQGAPAGDSEGTIQHIYNYNTTIPEQTVYNDCDNINNYNNTTNNWYMNDTPMDVTNDTETWVEKLIKFIIGVVDKIAGLIDKLINIILDVFGSILDGLIDMILELFDGLDLKETFFGWFSDLKEYIESIDLTLPVFNLPEMTQVESFNRLVQETMNIFINNNLGFVIFIPLILLIVRLVL